MRGVSPVACSICLPIPVVASQRTYAGVFGQFIGEWTRKDKEIGHFAVKGNLAHVRRFSFGARPRGGQV